MPSYSRRAHTNRSTVTLTIAAALTIGIMYAPRLLAQSDTAPIAFELASIKPVNAERTWARVAVINDRFVADGATLNMLIQFAYNLQYFQISGGPNWVGSREYTFDVQAKPETLAANSQVRRMVQSLLADRFRLKLHHERKDTAGYVLRVSDKGSKLKETAGGDAPAGFYSTNPLAARKMPMVELVDYLSGVILSRPVLDEATLTGRYDFSVKWTPDESQFRGAGGRGFYAGDPLGPTIFEAFQDQLGLKLEPRKVPTDYIVIDQADLPSEN